MSQSSRFFRREDSDTHVVVYVDGEIDLTVAGAMADELEATIDDGSSPLLVDLSAVTFMDSSGLSALMRVNRYAAASGGAMRLVAPSHRVAVLLSLTQLDHVLPVHDTIESAVNDPLLREDSS